ncbi:MAG TPA: amino acid racemase, partial [Alphaproteobacteria bacterium]|nr:amino acid racemase [Alphaproteobacteria bacterium]
NLVLINLDGDQIQKFREAGDDIGEGRYFAENAFFLERAGAAFILIASNTSHKNAPYIEKAVSIPVLHLAKATAKRVKDSGIPTVGLLGTKLTMEGDAYISHLRDASLDVIVPKAEDRDFISTTIYSDLIHSVVRPDVKERFLRIIDDLKARGAEGIILGCTELTILELDDVGVPLFDTTRIHVEDALDYSLS